MNVTLSVIVNMIVLLVNLYLTMITYGTLLMGQHSTSKRKRKIRKAKMREPYSRPTRVHKDKTKYTRKRKHKEAIE